MRAIQITEFGGPEVLQLVDIPKPEPKDGEVLIRVSRAGMNFADTHARENSYLAEQHLPLVPGGEVAGVREDTGERVVALLAGNGGYAEYAVAPAPMVVPIPEGLGEEAALSMLIQGTTAWHLYKTAAKMAEGESVVVHAAAGGTGSLAVQLGKAFGAGRVIATASTEDKRRLALELGADAAIDSSPEGMAERIIEANGGDRVDIVLEMSGGETFEQSRKALAPFGRLVAYGIASRQQNELRSGSLMRRSHAVVGFWLMHTFTRPGMFEEALADCFARAARGDLRVVVGPTYPLSDAGQAQIDIAERRTSGKVTLDVTRQV